MSRTKDAGRNKFKNRRTSLKVNLSFVSNTSLLTEDEPIASSSMRDINTDNSLEETMIIRKGKLSVGGSFSSKRFLHGVEEVDGTKKNIDQNLIKIKPSFVRMIRISTNTPFKTGSRKIHGGSFSLDNFKPSENTKRSSVLEDIRFPLDGEIFCPSASLVTETSMDITEVQGGMILLNHEPPDSEMLNASPGVDRRFDSSGIVQDTEDVRCDVIERREAVMIPDSEQDSFNTIRTSLNVNTSLDSRFSSVPNNSLYDPRKSRDGQDILAQNQTDDIPSYRTSQSSDGNAPRNSVVTTTALIEREDSSQDVDHREIRVGEKTVDLDPRRESYPQHHSTLDERVQYENDKSLDVKNPANYSSLTQASSTNLDSRDLHLRLNSEDNEPVESFVPGDLAKKPIRRKKKKLLSLRRSEVVDLSPVSTQIVPARRPVIKNRGRGRNKTAKKIVKEKDQVAINIATIYTSDDDIEEEEADPGPKKQKRVRKLKAKKIVVKNRANLWKEINENICPVNESCEEISSALGRTSLDDFELKKTLVRRRSRKIRPKIIIVVTGLPIEQKLFVKGTVASLGSAKVEKIVTRNTTHVVGKGTRTLNLLRGIVRGCWLVSFEWISKSHEAGEWLDPEEYEITSFSKAVRENRKEKQLFGAAYVSELFLTCGLIHIKEETSTPASVLKELVRIAGGRVTAQPEEAKIIIGRGGIKETWILDSIANGRIQPLELYCRKKCLD